MGAQTSLHDVSNVVFAGGGSRCAWQGGFWSELNRHMELRPQVIGTVNSSALVACLLFSQTFDKAILQLKQLATGAIGNSNWQNLFRGKSVFPHAQVYREIIKNCIDEKALQLLHQHDIRIQITRIPRWLPTSLGIPLGFTANRMDKLLTRSVHCQLPRRIGLRPETVSIRSCKTPQEVMTLLMASSSRPPFLPVGQFAGRPALDGSLVDNVPVNTIMSHIHKKTLVLLTQTYDRLPQLPNRIYIQPSRPIPIASWDCADPNRIQMTYELGVQDAQRYLQLLKMGNAA